MSDPRGQRGPDDHTLASVYVSVGGIFIGLLTVAVQYGEWPLFFAVLLLGLVFLALGLLPVIARDSRFDPLRTIWSRIGRRTLIFAFVGALLAAAIAGIRLSDRATLDKPQVAAPSIAAGLTSASPLPPGSPSGWSVLVNGVGDPVGVAGDAAGNVYVADRSGDRIVRFSQGRQTAAWGSRGMQPGQFNVPHAVAVFGNSVYVADFENHRIQKFDTDGKFILNWGSNGTGAAEFNHPIDVAVDGAGNVYVADLENYVIKKFTPEGRPLARFGTRGNGVGQFQSPRAVVIDAGGRVYVADYTRHRVLRFAPDGAFLEEWGGRGSEPGQFLGPHGLAIDSARSQLYVVEWDGQRIQQLTLDGRSEARLGTEGSARGQFNYPRAAVILAGRLLVADSRNGRIQQFILPPTR